MPPPITATDLASLFLPSVAAFIIVVMVVNGLGGPTNASAGRKVAIATNDKSRALEKQVVAGDGIIDSIRNPRLENE